MNFMNKTFWSIFTSAVEYDELTFVSDKSNLGLLLSHFPLNDLFICDNDYYCTEKFSYSEEILFNEITGLNVSREKIRITRDANWIENYGDDVLPGNIFPVHFTGKPFYDDFGIFKTEHEFNTETEILRYSNNNLIVSQKGLKFLFNNNCVHINGINVINDYNNIYNSFENYKRSIGDEKLKLFNFDKFYSNLL